MEQKHNICDISRETSPRPSVAVAVAPKEFQSHSMSMNDVNNWKLNHQNK